jgi:predicted lipoprotein with Yx(FWY)xxD motif
MPVTLKVAAGVKQRSRWVVVVLFGGAVLGLVAAGCGSSATHESAPSKASLARMYGSAGSFEKAPTPSIAPGSVTPPLAASAAIKVANTSLGSILADSTGRTVYLFEKDTGSTSACSGACAATWPPVTTTATQPTVAAGATQALLGTTIRSDGASQLTYDGHPLYRFAGDAKPGDTNGQGLQSFGGGWDALKASGQKVENNA